MLHVLSISTHASTVTRTAEVLGVQLPAGYVEQVAAVDAITAAAAQVTVTTEQLHNAVIAAIEAGKDYHKDAHVQRLALDRQLTSQNIGERARIRADQLLSAALAEYADDILEDWADALEPCSAALVAAADAGLSNLRETASVVAKGGENMAKLHHAQVAANAWTAAVNGFYSLAVVSRVGYTGDVGVTIYTPARLAALEPAFTLARQENTDPDAWTLARCGIPLRFATLRHFMARAAQFNADRQAAAADEERRRKERILNTW
ncbi:Uncharacterised protein [Mycobacteroides abscessus subsp. massiliense]|uniref:hypothetical protein n=1 Tax=Mycobacteroides abscessus TaxID=36809 RepID=UPI0009A77855|nr:hypothetical protein [Mycobacteroides abscessus]SLE60830.1 Uncharacterised protein [Mycobacteroides abscessus subsp. massiliense]